MNSIYAIDVKGFPQNDEIFSLKPLLSGEKRNQIDKYVKMEDKYRCIIGELLLQYSLWNYCDYKFSGIKLSYNEYGKPRLYDMRTYNIHFNISHSANWVVCAIFNKPVGIDVEYIDCLSNNSDIARRFFADIENDYIFKHSQISQTDAFYKLWTLKESYIKCMGKGLSIPLNSFSVILTEDRISLCQKNKIDYSCSFISRKIADDIYLGLCVSDYEEQISCNNMIYITIQQILDWGNCRMGIYAQ